MASDNEASCESDPNFAVICAFMEKFGTTCGLQSIDFLELQEMLENTQEVRQELIDLHIKLLRKSRKTVSNERWERAIIKFCHTFCVQDAWEIERFGYKKARLSSKLRVLKELLEMQFDFNARFKAEINKMSAEELRSQPLGKDKHGHAYWFQNDNNCQIRVYKEDPDEETWTLVAKDRDGLASLITELSDGDSKTSTESAINEEDSNSLAEKPIIDTGQVDSSSSDSNHKSENSNESKKEDNISVQNEEDGEDDDEGQSAKRTRESDEDNNENVKRTKIAEQNEVGEAVEEPVMLVKGEGSGEDNKCVNPIIGEEIEEDLMFFYGDGNGVDCETGNEDKTSDSQTNNQTENSDATTDTSDTNKISISDSKNCVKNVPTSPVKTQYKLGTIIDTKTDNKFFSSTVKSPTKTSRWDVETIISKDSSDTGRVKDLVNKFEQINDDEKEKETPKKTMFFFGPGCLQFNPATVAFGQKVPAENTNDTSSHENKKNEDKGDVGYRIGDDQGDNKVEYNDCVQSGDVDAGPLDNETPVETRIDEKLDSTNDNVIDAAIEETKVEEIDKHDKTEEIEKQIITEKQQEQEQEDNRPIPEVTAALIQSKELKSAPEISEPQSLTNNEEEPAPVVEETCIKKDAYVCGSEEPEATDKVEKVAPKEDVNIDENKNEQSVVELKSEVQKEDIEEKSKESEAETVEETKDTENVSTKVEEKEVVTATNTEESEKIDVNEKVEDNKEHDTKEVIETLSECRKEENTDSNQEETLKIEIDKTPNTIIKEAVVYIKDEDKKKVEEKEEETKDAVNNAAAKRGRKNNFSEQCNEDQKKPKVATRRTTRSTKNEEPVEEIGATRKGRTRAQKSEKEEAADDSNKKMKMSTEDETTKKSKRGKSANEEKETNSEKEESREVSPSPHIADVIVESSSSDVIELVEKDPLAVSEEEIKEKTKPMSLANFSLDFNESPAPTPPLTRSGLRKRGRESPQNVEDVENVEETGGKRLKMKPKRTVDLKLRKSIEEQKKKELVSSDDDSKSEEKNARKKAEQAKSDEAIVVSSDADKEAEPTKKKKKKGTVNKNKRLLSNLGIDPEQPFDFDSVQPSGVRQSRRIAQLKIKEEAERRKFEEEATVEQRKKKKSKKSEDKDYKAEKKKPKNEDEEEAEDDSSDSKKKRKKKKKKKDKLMFDEYNPWKSSSGSSSSDEEVEEEEEIGEEDDEVLQYVSDHEFSPESDMEGDAEAQPLKRARTARKESDIEEVDDCPCEKCGKSDHPEWILLCDSCDNGWHCSCLRPPLLVIPEGDWFCPPCQHASLLKNLNEKLQEFEKKLNKKEIEDRRKQRLAYVGISLNNVLPTKEAESIKKRKHKRAEENDDDEDDDEYGNDVGDDDEDGEEGDEEESSDEDSESGSGSASETDSDEPIYQLRQRRQAHSYRFNDYDELINSAIQDEMEAVKGAGNQGRGKDISTIVNAEKEEEKKKETEEKVEQEPLPPVVPLNEKDKEPKPVFEDDDIVQAKKKIIGRKKHRKLNSLDISDEDDEDSDEDFKGTTTESDDDFDEDLGSEDSDLDAGRNRRRGGDPVRRSTRARTSRYDADFIDDGSSDSEDDAPRRKKKRSIWDESESEESDKSWGRRKRKSGNRSRRTIVTTTKKKKSKKKKKHNDSDEEVYKKKKPKIKFGLEGDDDGPVRRTRGKKINYIDALGSDSDDDRGKRPLPRIESDEEYVANDDDVPEDEKISEEETDYTKGNKVQIQSYTDAKFTKILPEPKNQFPHDEIESELNPIDQINRNVEMMDENEMEKMMEDEEYANKHLQMVAQQLEKEKRRKEREAKKLEIGEQQLKKVTTDPKDQFQFSGSMQEPLVGNVDNLIVNSENNDELSEPPGVSLPLFDELGDGLDEQLKKRRGKTKKSLEETVATLGTARQQEVVVPSNPYAPHPTDLSGGDNNLEIAAPPQPFSQSQPTPSVITRMLQNKPGQPGYPVGTIRPKQFATMPERDEEVHHPLPTHGQYNAIQGGGLRSFRGMANYPRPQIRQPIPPVYHSHRPLDPSPSGGGAINMADHNSPGRVVSPASSSPGSNKNETPPPPYSRPPPSGRFSAGPRHVVPQQMVAPPPPPLRPNLSPYHPGLPPAYHYSQFGGQEDALPPTVYQNSPYSEQFDNSQVNTSENSNNSKTFDEESGGEFGGLVSYFSSQREDDLES